MTPYFVQFGGNYKGQPVFAGYFDANDHHEAVNKAHTFFNSKPSFFELPKSTQSFASVINMRTFESFLPMVSI